MCEKLYQTKLPSFDEGPENKAEVGLRYSQGIPKRTVNLIYVLSNSSHVDPLLMILGTLSNDNDDGSENVGKQMNLRSFERNRVYFDPLNMSSAGDFSWS